MARKIRRRRKKGAQADNAIKGVRAQRGLDRQRHFGEGKPLVGTNGWFSPHTVTTDRKKQRARSACRGRATY